MPYRSPPGAGENLVVLPTGPSKPFIAILAILTATPMICGGARAWVVSAVLLGFAAVMFGVAAGVRSVHLAAVAANGLVVRRGRSKELVVWSSVTNVVADRRGERLCYEVRFEGGAIRLLPDAVGSGVTAAVIQAICEKTRLLIETRTD